MSLLIKGMNIPKEGGIKLRINDKGEVFVYGVRNLIPTTMYKAIEVPTQSGPIRNANVAITNMMKYEQETTSIHDANAVKKEES